MFVVKYSLIMKIYNCPGPNCLEFKLSRAQLPVFWVETILSWTLPINSHFALSWETGKEGWSNGVCVGGDTQLWPYLALMAGEVEGDRMAVKIAHAGTPQNNLCAWSNFSSNFFLWLWHVLHILSLRIDTSPSYQSFLSANMEDQHVDIKRSHWLMRRLARGHHLQIKCGNFVRSQHKLVWYVVCIALMILLTARFCVCYDAASCVGGGCAGDLGSHTGTASMLLLAPPLWANHLSHIHHRWPLLSSKILENYYFWFSAETEGPDHLPLIAAL